MATSVYETETLEINGTEVSMRPLKIANLRKFMVAFSRLPEVITDSDASMDVLTDCVAISLKQWAPKLVEKELKARLRAEEPQSDVTEEKLFREIVEEELDMNDYKRVIRIAAGIDMDAEGNAEAAGPVGMI